MSKLKSAEDWSKSCGFGQYGTFCVTLTQIREIQANAMRHAASMVIPDGNPAVAIERINQEADDLLP